MNTIYDNTFVLGQTSATNFVAGPGIKIDEPCAGTVRIGNDETVIFSGAGTSAASISEDIHNFEQVQLHLQHGTYGPAQVFTINPITMGTTGYFAITRPRGVAGLNVAYIRFEVNQSGISAVNSKMISFGSWTNNTVTGSSVDLNNPEDRNSIIKVVGINRISSSNA